MTARHVGGHTSQHMLGNSRVSSLCPLSFLTVLSGNFAVFTLSILLLDPRG